MPLRLVRRPRRPHFYLRGAVLGQPVFETTRTDDAAAAAAIRDRRHAALLAEGLAARDPGQVPLKAVRDLLASAIAASAGDDARQRQLRALIDEADQALRAIEDAAARTPHTALKRKKPPAGSLPPAALA